MAVPDKVQLQSSDKEVFEVDAEVATQSKTIKDFMDEGIWDSSPIPLPNVSSAILSKVIEFSKHHAEATKTVGEGNDAGPVKSDEEIEAWNAEFVKMDHTTLFELILAANYLHHKALLDLTCQAVADCIKGKSVEELREEFGIVNDYTPEEEEQVRKENQWEFEVKLDA